MSKLSIPTCVALIVSLVTLIAQAGPGADEPNEAILQPPYGTVYALLVGVENYSHCSWSDLNFAIDDARELAALLRDRFGYSTNVLENPTKNAMLAEMDGYANKLGPDDVFIFFYAGHGKNSAGSGEDNQQRVGYFVPRIEENLNALIINDVRFGFVDEHPFEQPVRLEPSDDGSGQSDQEYAEAVASARSIWERGRIRSEHDARINEASIRMDTLRQRLFSTGAKHVIGIFDTCFAGLATRGGGSAHEQLHVVNASLVRHYRLISTPSRSIFTAGTGGEEAIEHLAGTRGFDQLAKNKPLPVGGIPHGVFTYELLGVLGETPSEGATLTSIRESVAFRVDNVLTHIGGERRMTPQLRPYGAGDGEFVFVPKPSKDWLANTEKAIKIAIADAKGAGQGRGDLEAVLEQDAQMDQQQAHFDRLMSKALVVLSFQAGQTGAERDLTQDPIWIARHKEVLARASTGDADAMAALFYMYRHGLGTAPDDARAGHWAAEAAASDSGDAHEAWITALRDNVGIDGTAAAEHGRQEALREAEKITPRQQTAAVAALVAVTAAASSDNEEAAGWVALVAGTATMLASLQEKPDESIEKLIATIGKDVRMLSAIVGKLGQQGDFDMEILAKAKASILSRQRNIVEQVRRSRRGAVGQQVLLELIGRSSSDLVMAIQELNSPLTRKKYEPARQAFVNVEIAYAKLVALMPYQLNEVSWE